MKPKEAIRWLEAILDDTLERNDERDTERINAIELAIEALRTYRKEVWHLRSMVRKANPLRVSCR